MGRIHLSQSDFRYHFDIFTVNTSSESFYIAETKKLNFNSLIDNNQLLHDDDNLKLYFRLEKLDKLNWWQLIFAEKQLLSNTSNETKNLFINNVKLDITFIVQFIE